MEQSAESVSGGEGSGLAGQKAEKDTGSGHTECEASAGGDPAAAPAQKRKHKLWKTV